MAEGRKSDAIVARAIQRAAAELETEYRAQRAGDAESLYEQFVEIIDAQHPNVEVLVFVLEMLRTQVIEQKARALFATPGQPAQMPTAATAAERANGLEETLTR